MAAASLLFRTQGGSWEMFAALFLVPGVAFAAFLAGPRIGSIVYNALHTTLGPLLLIGAGYGAGRSLFVQMGLVWLAHIGFDRALGFGLKYASGFAATHLGMADFPKR